MHIYVPFLSAAYVFVFVHLNRRELEAVRGVAFCIYTMCERVTINWQSKLMVLLVHAKRWPVKIGQTSVCLYLL